MEDLLSHSTEPRKPYRVQVNQLFHLVSHIFLYTANKRVWQCVDQKNMLNPKLELSVIGFELVLPSCFTTMRNTN